MKTHHPFIRVLLMSILAGLLVASAGMASAAHLGIFRTSAEKPTVRQDSAACAPDDEGTSDDQGNQDESASDDQGSSQDSQECEDPEGDGTTQPGEGDGSGQPPAPGNPADREAECNAAAGVQAAPDGTVSGSTPEGSKTTGLDHAIEVVLANCIKNPQAPGLLNALKHLVQNRDRHQAHDAEKAARRAAREAAKAARQATVHGKGHS